MSPRPAPTDVADPRRAKENARRDVAVTFDAGGQEVIETVMVVFEAQERLLPASAEGPVWSLAQKLAARENLRFLVHGYAGGGSLTESQARRLSLARAISVRKHLIDIGIAGTRINVRAFGTKSPEGPPNRVDVIAVEP